MFTKIKKFNLEKSEETLNQILNHLFIIYIFSFPISSAHKSIFIVILFVFIIRGNYRKYFGYAFQNNVIRALTVFALMHILWMFVSDDYLYTKSIIRSSLYYLYPIVFITFMDYRYISRYLFAFFLSMLFSELFSYGLFFELIPSHWGFYNNPADPSPFYHHTHYGMALAFTLSIIFYDFFTQKEKPYIKILLSIFFVTASINLFINGGRTGYLMYLILLVGMGFWFLKTYSYKIFSLILPILLLAFYLAYSYSPAFQKRLNNTESGISRLIEKSDYSSSIGSRVGAWKYSIPVIKEHLFFGVGTGNQLNEIKKYTIQHDPSYYKIFTGGDMVHLHNQYVSVLIQFGVIGLLIYFFLLYSLLKYKQENHLLKTIQVFLVLSVIFFGFIDILTEASALALLLFTTLIPITLLRTSDYRLQTTYTINNKTVWVYFALAILFFLINKFT